MLPANLKPPLGGSELCFILGIDYRSGTNHLYQLLRLHPQCVGLAPIWEDFVLHHSHHLHSYVQSLFGSWNPKWRVDEQVGTRGDLLRSFGVVLENFLMKQTLGGAPESSPKRFVTKTPSVEGLENFFELFPTAIPIVLIRDGRCVVESGMKSFGWNFQQASERWRRRARRILEFESSPLAASRLWLKVRFEDLVRDERGCMTAILKGLGLDVDLYDFHRAGELKILGGSESAQKSGDLHWRSTEKPAGFDPTDRISHWTDEQREQFNRIAGEELRLLGYE